jgi:NitT/TauT family transport system substrate-binding protein
MAYFKRTMRFILGMQTTQRIFYSVCILLLLIFTAPAIMAKHPMRIAIGDVPGMDVFNFLAAVERAKERGVDIQVYFLHSEDIAAQAVIGGEADIGVGTPYGLIQQGESLRFFYQLSSLRFFPVVNTNYYKTWEDLDGVDIYTHARGSGTEAIMNLMAGKKGIKYKSMNYLPGSAVRAQAMMQEEIKVSIVDAERCALLTEKGNGRFSVLPLPEIKASDEALYAKMDYFKRNEKDINIFLEELLIVWRLINKDYHYIIDAQKKYKLLPDLWKRKKTEALEYYKDFSTTGGFPNDGGGERAAMADLEFYGIAGTIKGDINKLKVEDYWYLRPLNTAIKNLNP